MKNALISLFVTLAFPKTITQRHKFHLNDFYYSTKFGAPANSNIQINYKARLLNYVKSNDEQPIYLEIAAY